MKVPLSNMEQPYLGQMATAADSKENNQNQTNVDEAALGLLKLADAVADQSNQFFSNLQSAPQGSEQVTQPIRKKHDEKDKAKMIPKFESNQKGIKWSDKDSAKLIKLKGKNPHKTAQELSVHFQGQYTGGQVSHRITCLHREYRENEKSLKKYVGKAGLTKGVLAKFIERIPKQKLYSKRVIWSVEDSAKLIRLKVENPGKMYRDLSLEFTVQYGERRIGNRLSNLYQEYRKNKKSLGRYVGKAGLTKEVLKKFIGIIPTDVSSENWAEWSDKDIAKLIKLRVEKSNETYHGLSKEFAGQYDESKTGSRLVRLYNQYRKNKKSLDKYVGQEGLTKDHLEQFIEMIPESQPYQKKMKWSDKDTIKLIKLRANDPKRPHLKLVDEFKGLYTGKQIDHRLLTLYRKHRRNSALRKYLGTAGLTEALLEKFIATIPKEKKSKHLTS